MEWEFVLSDSCRLRFRAGDIEIDDHRLLPAAHHHGLYRLIAASVDFLVGHVRRYVDEIARSGLIDILEMLSPSKPCSALHDVQHGLQFAVMVRTRFGVGLHYDRACPELLRAGGGVCDG